MFQSNWYLVAVMSVGGGTSEPLPELLCQRRPTMPSPRPAAYTARRSARSATGLAPPIGATRAREHQKQKPQPSIESGLQV